jgi:flagellar biosynthetic protein FlhB
MAEEQDKSQQTEEATPKRIEDARRKGQVATSREPSTALSFLAFASLGITGAGAYMVTVMAKLMRDFLSGKVPFDATGQGMRSLLELIGKDMAAIVLPFAIPLMVLGVLATVMVSGPVFSLEALAPKMSKLNPLNGIKNLFSTRALSELVKSILKISVISLACWIIFGGLWGEVFHAMGGAPIDIARLAASGSMKLAGIVAVIFFFIALADVLYQRWEYAKSLRMSKKEIKDEHKDSEGDPHLKAKIRRIQMEQARSRMMTDVPKADVVITNPTHIAVALSYEQGGLGAPKVVAKGKGKVAEQIRAIAREHGVPVRENKPLARSLFKLVKLGDAIPEHLYEAVALILAEVYRMKAAQPTGG